VDITYKKLWKLLIDRDIKKGDLCRMAGFSPNTLAKMGRGENVTIETLAKICEVLNCEISDIMEFLRDKNS